MTAQAAAAYGKGSSFPALPSSGRREFIRPAGQTVRVWATLALLAEDSQEVLRKEGCDDRSQPSQDPEQR